MNRIFVIEGTDGSGKQTQTQRIYERLIEDGYSIFKTSFPNYESLSSGPVREYLSGNISSDPSEVSAKAASTFYAVDRYITYKQKIEPYYLDEKTIILFDRYVSSNLLHQGGKILAKTKETSGLDSFYEWVYNLEHKDLELPEPTAVFFLYVPVDYTLNLIKERKNKINDEEKKDIHELDTNHLENASKSGLYAANKFGWHIINCVRGSELRSIDDINDEIYKIIKDNLCNSM